MKSNTDIFEKTVALVLVSLLPNVDFEELSPEEKRIFLHAAIHFDVEQMKLLKEDADSFVEKHLRAGEISQEVLDCVLALAKAQ